MLLTHTNAGVDVLTKRLKKHHISKEKYTIQTIAAFCIKWCMAYYHSASFDISLSPLNGKTESGIYYTQLYSGAKKIFEKAWSGNVLKSSYTGVVVDEYQDCIIEQHEIIRAINCFLPIRILGDPLQGIFSFAGKLVDWDHLGFQIVPIETEPWRWKSTNPALGMYLSEIRDQMIPILSGNNCTVHLSPCEGSIYILDPTTFDGYRLLKEYQKEFQEYKNVLYLARLEHEQLFFAQRMPNIFQQDEKQDCNELYEYAKKFDEEMGYSLALCVIKFANICATKINVETKSYQSRLEKGSLDFSRIEKHLSLGQYLITLVNEGSYTSVKQILLWFQSQKAFNIYRKELFSEMLRSLDYAHYNDVSIFDAANHIRKDAALQMRYTKFKYLSSRTVLAKGLEFDCVIIDMRDPLSAKDFYVAMTRAMRKIYIITPSVDLDFQC